MKIDPSSHPMNEESPCRAHLSSTRIASPHSWSSVRGSMRCYTEEQVQPAWALLLHCATVRATYQLRVARFVPTLPFANSPKPMMRVSGDVCVISVVDVSQRDKFTRITAGSFFRAFWADWANSFHVTQRGHPLVAEKTVQEFVGMVEFCRHEHLLSQGTDMLNLSLGKI